MAVQEGVMVSNQFSERREWFRRFAERRNLERRVVCQLDRIESERRHPDERRVFQRRGREDRRAPARVGVH
jgi:hypothetical protein